MDGIIEICEELEMDPATDVRVLVMVWRLQNESNKTKRNPSEISQEDFVAGMDKMRYDRYGWHCHIIVSCVQLSARGGVAKQFCHCNCHNYVFFCLL